MLGKDCIYSLKLKPSPLAQPVLDEDYLRRETREYLSITRNNHTEIIMKDNHTQRQPRERPPLGGDPPERDGPDLNTAAFPVVVSRRRRFLVFGF
jgi:hypothetical protein